MSLSVTPVENTERGNRDKRRWNSEARNRYNPKGDLPLDSGKVFTN